jgi:hypothetical protein
MIFILLMDAPLQEVRTLGGCPRRFLKVRRNDARAHLEKLLNGVLPHILWNASHGESKKPFLNCSFKPFELGAVLQFGTAADAVFLVRAYAHIKIARQATLRQ